MTYRSKTPHLAALVGAAALMAITDLQAASTRARQLVTFGETDENAAAKKAVLINDGSCAMAAASPMTTLQMQVDTAGAAPTHKATAAKTFDFNGLGSSANGIGIDGAGSASAPAKKFTCIGEARGAFIGEAGVDFGGSSCGEDEGKAPIGAIVAALSMKKASSAARRRA